MASAVVTRADPGGVWAWCGVRIDAAVDLSRRAELARLREQERLDRVVEDQLGFVQRMLGAQHEAVGLRYLAAAGRLEVYLLGRVRDADEATARRRAAALAERLRSAPDHVVTVVVESEDELSRVLDPFVPADGGLAQIHKQVRVADRNRPDAQVLRYLAVEPFSRTRVSWTPLLEVLRSSPHPVCLSADLEPVQVSADVRRMLETESTRYKRLSEGREQQLDLGGRIALSPDAAALAVHPVYQDALARYTSRCFRFSLTVASPVPLDPGVAEEVGRVVSPMTRSPKSDVHDPFGVVSGFQVLRPATQEIHEWVRQGLPYLVAGALRDQVLEAELATDQRLHDVGPQRAPLRELRTLVDASEAASLFRLPVAVDGHVPGLRVVAPADRVRRLDEVRGPSVLLGAQAGTTGEDGAVRLAVTDLPRHGFVVGTPGSGKTNTALHLCRQLADQQIPFAVIEPVNSDLDDYRWLATLPGLEDLVVLTVGDESVAPFRLNPFQVPVGVTVVAHVSNLLACFEAAFGLWDPLPFLYRRALTLAYRRKGFHPDDRGVPGDPGWPVLSDFVDAISHVTAELGYQGEIGANIDAAATLRAQSLVEGACGQVLDCRTSFDIGVLMRRPVVYELASVGDNPKEQALVTLLLVNAMRGHYRHARRRDEPPHVILLEEAHRVFPRATASSGSGDQKEGNAQALAAERIAQGLAEDRKYRQSYLLIDQQVGKVAEDAYKITNLKVMHRTAAEEDRKLLGTSMSMSDDQVKTAASLKPFEALVSHNALDRAVTVVVPDVRRLHAAELGLDEAPLADDDELRARHRRLLELRPELADAMAPFRECAPCRSRCRFRSRSASYVADTDVADSIASCVIDENGDPLLGPDMSKALVSMLPPPPAAIVAASVADGVDAWQSGRDFRLCTWVHAYRAAYPPLKWSSQGPQIAVDWAEHVASILDAADET